MKNETVSALADMAMVVALAIILGLVIQIIPALAQEVPVAPPAVVTPPGLVVEPAWWHEGANAALTAIVGILGVALTGFAGTGIAWLTKKMGVENAARDSILASGMEVAIQNGLKFGADAVRKRLALPPGTAIPEKDLPSIVADATEYVKSTKPDAVSQLDISKNLPAIIATRIPDILAGVVEGVHGKVAGAAAAGRPVPRDDKNPHREARR